MNKIILVITCYNDIEPLRVCLSSVVPYVDGCVAIDSAWKDYPSEEHYSTDGTPEFIRDQFKDKFFHLIKPVEWYDCIDTYNLGHEYVESHFDMRHTWWMTWDCDWQLIPQKGYSQIHVADEWGRLRDGTLNRYRMLWGKMHGHWPDRKDEPNAFLGYRDIKGVRHRITHWTLYDSDGREIKHFQNRYPAFVLKQSMLVHRWDLRPKHRFVQQNEYYKQRTEWSFRGPLLKQSYPLLKDPNANVGYDLNLVFPHEPSTAQFERIVGMMTVYNEADIVGHVIEHLVSQGIELVVLDNGSTDGSYEIVKRHIGKGILSVDRIETENFEKASIFRTLHGMAIQYSPDWMLLTAADEFLESPYRGLTLSKAVQLEGERGHNMIQFNNFEFFPTEKDHDNQETDVRKRLRYYSWHDDDQFRCWRMYRDMSVFGTYGHDAKLPDGIRTRVSPNKFILRHYKIRSYEHGLRKIFSERLPRLLPEERAKGWNVQYDNIGTDRNYFVIDSIKLTRYEEDGNWNLTKTFDGSFGAWNPPSASERISELENCMSKLENSMSELENSVSLRIGRSIPLGSRVRKLLIRN